MSYALNPWKVVQEGLDEDIRLAESLTSIGNGYMGMRGNFEEDFSGDTHRGTYIGGVWFPDKTRVGWWKNGYPQYFGKAINCPNLIGIRVLIDGEPLDIAKMPLLSFRREVDMHSGVFSRQFTVKTDKGTATVSAKRFVSLAQKELLAISYSVTPDYACDIEMKPYLDGNVHNLDSNYGETFWDMLEEEEGEEGLAIKVRTKENPFGAPRFTVSAAMSCWSDAMDRDSMHLSDGYAEMTYSARLEANETADIEKYVTLFTDRDVEDAVLNSLALSAAARARDVGFDALIDLHAKTWLERWEHCDAIIEGDDAAQQGVRFNLFHLLSTYSGEDSRLNIGPKGFTGEKYGGATYWDTEAYCLPVYMAVVGQDVAKQLLLYRYRQLPQAYENAREQGLEGALYPMVTFMGRECHNEWEITFEEIHRNGAIAHAIFDYTAYTGDESYRVNEGLDVLLGIARFYTGRAHFSKRAGKYMIHGVTGPNEYENNVNNNWYTNRIAVWSIEYFLESYSLASYERQAALGATQGELDKMRAVTGNMYYPVDEETGIFVQHDTFLDKELMPASELPESERPINQHWSWDRILRSCFIKQADVLQGLYFLSHLYDVDTKRRNFDFYEPMTVHESSLSPCVHSILASELGYKDKAMEMYTRTARLDLDNINNDTGDGLHITSMAGSWLSLAQGFAGMRTSDGLSFAPYLPSGWTRYAFRVIYRGRTLLIDVERKHITLTLISGEPVVLTLLGKELLLSDTLVASI